MNRAGAHVSWQNVGSSIRGSDGTSLVTITDVKRFGDDSVRDSSAAFREQGVKR